MRVRHGGLHLTLAILALVCVGRASATVGASYEIFTDRVAFEARLGTAPRVINFDDIDTTKTDPVAFDNKRYKYSHGATITGEDGQFASTEFDPASNMPPSSLPNEYAPGPVSDIQGEGGNETDLHFFVGLRPARVAGVGVVFIDTDFPGDGPSSLAVFDEDGVLLATTGTVSGGDGSQLFRGIIAIDGADMPTPDIFRAHVVSGEGWAENFDNETVALDDICFSAPVSVPGLGGEDCGNCVDDDGDGAIDRLDDECSPTPVGDGLNDPKGAGKNAVKCQTKIQKAAAKFVLNKAKRLQKCLQAVAKCYQEKGGAPDCITKATGKCDKEIAKIGDDETKLKNKIIDSCDTLDIADLKDGDGLGYSAEAALCADIGVGSLDTTGDIADCIVIDHECRVERLIGTVVPRAFEYLTAVGQDPGTDFPCLPIGLSGGGAGLSDSKAGKAIGKCDKEIQKTTSALLKEAAKVGQKCSADAAKCQQQKPDDPKCLPKASGKCAKALDKLLDPLKGKAAKLLAKTGKKCTSTAFSFADLGDSAGLALTAAAARCSELGFGIGTQIGLLNCLGADILCEAVRMGEKQAPRLRQYGDVLKITLPDEIP